MKFTLGIITGIAAAWAALAIWQRIPQPMGDSDDGRCVCGCDSNDEARQVKHHWLNDPVDYAAFTQSRS